MSWREGPWRTAAEIPYNTTSLDLLPSIIDALIDLDNRVHDLLAGDDGTMPMALNVVALDVRIIHDLTGAIG